MSPTKLQRKRLTKLADYLESLKRGYKQFDMALYFDGDNHHYGAAARIRYVLAGKPLPEVIYFKPATVKLYKEYRK